ncbi:MAG: hypothetical protein K2G93_04490 [Rikenella sp.]|nr:hypothetical protein [Rikenella sp.]
MYYVGFHGYSWASSVTGSHGYFLDITHSRIAPNTSNYRAFGLQLRCLQE